MITLLNDLSQGCRVTYEEGFLTASEAERWMETLSRELPFAPESPVMFGRPVTVRRRSCAVGDPGVRYRYSGLTREAKPWPEGLQPLREAVGQRAGARFNFALCNLYPDGAAGLGWHSDDERDLLTDAPIASLSLGAPRDFALRPRAGGRATFTVSLAPGSLLVMWGATQRFYQHRVPPRPRRAEPRVNLTFRVMRPR